MWFLQHGFDTIHQLSLEIFIQGQPGVQASGDYRCDEQVFLCAGVAGENFCYWKAFSCGRDWQCDPFVAEITGNTDVDLSVGGCGCGYGYEYLFCRIRVEGDGIFEITC